LEGEGLGVWGGRLCRAGLAGGVGAVTRGARVPASAGTSA
jgi:hypothetical protein